MRAPRFNVTAPLTAGQRLALEPATARHAIGVLRLGVGDRIVLFDGTGGEHDATIEAAGRDAATVAVGPKRQVEREPPFPIVLAQALAKGERMDMVVQKAVELGATAIQPLATRRCEVKLDAERAARRVEHWRGVVRAACEQCGRNRLPEVRAPLALDRLTARGALWVLDPDGDRALIAQQPPAAGVTLVVGPEGGLAPEEIALLVSRGATAVTLGPRVLRTETAGLAALAALLACWGDLGAPRG